MNMNYIYFWQCYFKFC